MERQETGENSEKKEKLPRVLQQEGNYFLLLLVQPG